MGLYRERFCRPTRLLISEQESAKASLMKVERAEASEGSVMGELSVVESRL